MSDAAGRDGPQLKGLKMSYADVDRAFWRGLPAYQSGDDNEIAAARKEYDRQLKPRSRLASGRSATERMAMSRRPRPLFSKDPGRFANVPRQQTPEPTEDLGAAGRDAWNYVWRHHWIVPERRMTLVERYCRTQAFATVAAGGLMSVGSHGQQRAHPCMAAIRLMSTESRLMEIELGLTPVAESRAAIPKGLPTRSIDEQIQRRRAYLQIDRWRRPSNSGQPGSGCPLRRFMCRHGTATIWEPRPRPTQVQRDHGDPHGDCRFAGRDSQPPPSGPTLASGTRR